MNLNQKVSDYIHDADQEQAEIMELLRGLIHRTVDGVTEEIKWGFPVFAKSKDFTYLRLSKNHVTLGFYNITQLEDPNNRLEGNGTTLRHVKIRKKADIDSKLLVKWFEAIS